MTADGGSGLRGRVTVRDLRRLLSRAAGARLSYGRPVTVGDRTIIPVARVRFAGGFGFGESPGSENPGRPSTGGGGGGVVDSRPLGFIEATPEGTRFQPIAGRGHRTRMLAVAVAAGAVAGTAVAGSTVGALALRRVARAATPVMRRLPRPTPRRRTGLLSRRRRRRR
ncbi:MAG: hypothetical protein QOD76_315 [Solirubrobacteraceae bacterium]|nr:hypothetical protein [Solirubrobacteraceae bacterium]